MRSLLFLLFSFQLVIFARDGIEYSYIESSPSTYFHTIHMIEVDPSLYDIKPVKALDNGIGRESVLSLAERNNAIGAVNGGFFSIGGTFEGRACGALKINEWYSFPIKPRGCIGWSSKTQSAIFDRLMITCYGLHNSKAFSIDGLNKPRKPNEVILFSSVFNRTTLTSLDGEEITIIDGVVKDIKKHQGSSKIPENGYVLSIHKDSPLFDSFKIGDLLSFEVNVEPQDGLTTSEDWKDCEYIVGGTPLLISNSAKIMDFSSELTIPTFISRRHARTAIGILPNGHWLFVVVDKLNSLDGMTIKELTEFMYSMGCTYALNLDGGGSSTLVYEKKVKNSPQGYENEVSGLNVTRRVSDAVVIVHSDSKLK